jgi:glyoxylase-like metal-dependent hydrolase (beta-lactamase superfamily II)
LIPACDRAVLVHPPDVSRRAFLADLGRGAIVVAVGGIGLAACVPSGSAQVSGSAGPEGPSSRPATAAAPAASPDADPTSPPGGSPAGLGLRWERVHLGFVSAYVLERGGEAAIVDTGVPGSEGAIGDVLAALGLGWEAVAHVIATHHHGDHAGSLAAILERSVDATAYAGAADIPLITSPRAVVPVGDGERVFDLRVIATPGHTAGHIAVLDEAAGVLIAGDALRTADGAAIGPNPSFSADMDQAMASVSVMAGLRFETLLVGHGEPILAGAQPMVEAIGAA